MSHVSDPLQRCTTIQELHDFTTALSPKYDMVGDTYFAHPDHPSPLYRMKDLLEVTQKVFESQSAPLTHASREFLPLMNCCKNIRRLQKHREKTPYTTAFFPLVLLTRTLQSAIDRYSFDSAEMLNKTEAIRKNPINRMSYNLSMAIFQQLREEDNEDFENASEVLDPKHPPTLFSEQTIQDTQVFIAYNQGHKKVMQDDYLVETFTFRASGEDIEGAIYAVFDGHGKDGDLVAKYVKDNMKNCLIEFLEFFAQEKLSPDEIFMALKAAFQELNARISEDLIESGTTSTVVLKIGDTLWCANCGDSRAVMGLERSPKEITPEDPRTHHAVQLTEDQIPSDFRYLQKIKELGGIVTVRGQTGTPRVGGRIAPARSFGNKNIVGMCSKPKISNVGAKGFIVLATDGLFYVASTKNVVESTANTILTDQDANPATVLINKAMNAYSHDNIAAIVVKFAD